MERKYVLLQEEVRKAQNDLVSVMGNVRQLFPLQKEKCNSNVSLLNSYSTEMVDFISSLYGNGK